MKWPDEIRSPAELTSKQEELDDDEIDRAVDLVEAMTTDDLSGFHDEYRETLEAVIAAQAQVRPAQRSLRRRSRRGRSSI
ncbi:hypothetical protein [Streptomyces sp. NPDC000410]|uniref:hypothetical protein n=1 Tax=Streptomyces sp. NPDC000410 TaxID=3154254 RepID=UPI003329F6EC